jgi:tetratricopeptide (TPR) repeat protein
LYIASSFLIAKYLELPSNWYSREVLQTLPPSKILELTLGALFAALFGAYTVYRVMLEMNWGLPAPQTSVEALQMALIFGHKAQEEYLSSYRKSKSTVIVDALIEDLPLKVSSEKDSDFLKNNKHLNEAEKLFKQAIALEQYRDGTRQTYNVANGLNKLGYHYRFRRDWEKATDCLQECLEILEKLQREQPSNLAIPGEKTTAYFHLGQVFMARYRESNDFNDRKLAEDYLQKSIQIDKEYS